MSELDLNEDFSQYMNPPECSVSIGDVCERTDMDCENPYLVKDIKEKDGKFWAVCDHVDEFSGDEVEETIYHFYLKRYKGVHCYENILKQNIYSKQG